MRAFYSIFSLCIYVASAGKHDHALVSLTEEPSSVVIKPRETEFQVQTESAPNSKFIGLREKRHSQHLQRLLQQQPYVTPNPAAYGRFPPVPPRNVLDSSIDRYTSNNYNGNIKFRPDGQPLGEIYATSYYYPPKLKLPLPKCFLNPTGYVCCNKHLNNLIVESYVELEKRPKFHTCNIQAIATHLQVRAEKRFNTSFETIASYEDFAQKIHFKSDFVCKVELDGKYMLAYATVKNVTQVQNQADLPTSSHPPLDTKFSQLT